jgi:hypothetical protein
VYLKEWTPKDFLQCRKDRGRWEKIVAQAEFAKIVALLADVLLYARQTGEPKFYDTTQKIKTALQRIYCDLDETGIHKMGILGSIFSCHHSETRVDLKPISDALEKGFTNLKSRGKL